MSFNEKAISCDQVILKPYECCVVYTTTHGYDFTNSWDDMYSGAYSVLDRAFAIDDNRYVLVDRVYSRGGAVITYKRGCFDIMKGTEELTKIYFKSLCDELKV